MVVTSSPGVATPATTAGAGPADVGLGHETTRYLCGAAYTDPRFREAVLARRREVFRAVPPEVGIDVGMITAHCRRATTSKAIRDLIICAPTAVLAFLVVGFLAGPGVVPYGGLVMCWLAAAVITAVDEFSLDRVVRGSLTREAFYRQQLQPETELDTANVVVYSGFSPFVGSGSDLGGWSFAIDLERPQQDPTAPSPKRFELPELYERVSAAFAELRIPNLRLRRRLFVSGRAIRHDRLLLPDIHKRPVDRVPDDVVESFAASGSTLVRHYLCVETVDWNGEFAVTQFIRFRKLSCKLFVEVSTFMVPPLKAAYYDLDKVHPNLRFKDAVRLLIVSAVKALFLLIVAPFASLSRLQTAITNWRHKSEERKQIDENLLFDYGASQSLRELASANQWRVYFQKLDKEMHHKILQQHLVDSLVDFLDEHGVDTSDIKERTTHILNNGVIVSGGSITAQGLAVGQGAQARVGAALRAVRAAGSA